MTTPSHADLKAGDEGWWPVIGAQPFDVHRGDRVSFPDTPDEWIDVMHVHQVNDGIHTRIVPPIPGAPFLVGNLFHGMNVDRWGTSSKLADSVR